LVGTSKSLYKSRHIIPQQQYGISWNSEFEIRFA
jgi:hypothetical protein